MDGKPILQCVPRYTAARLVVYCVLTVS